MRNATGIMNEFRECMRHLWNAYFRAKAEPSTDWDLQEAFDEVAGLLFGVLVLRNMGRQTSEYYTGARWGSREPYSFLHVLVDQGSPIMVNREGTSGYWDDPLVVVKSGQLSMRFIEFFDWDQLGFREFAHYRVRIVGSEQFPHLVGRDALLPVGTTVKIECEDVAEQGEEADERLGRAR